ncbi:MAG TPA: hypothetical protein VI815_03090 [Candidatus Nanoarchaeia archaeon]|nr:hypothetical protein [Candidatus Nanoarchaeia archaeon]
MKVNILIGTPAYNSQIHIDYLNSIIDMHRLKLPISVMCIGNESLITRGRNTIISFFKTHEEFTHLLFLDADIGIKGDSIIKLIQHEKDVIGAPVPLKGFDSNGNKVYNITNPIKEENLYTVDKVGTAVFMLSRKAVEDLCNNSDTYNGNTMSRGLQNNNINYDVFKTGIENEIYLSEDYYACKKLKELGYKIYIDDTIITIHNGMFQF